MRYGHPNDYPKGTLGGIQKSEDKTDIEKAEDFFRELTPKEVIDFDLSGLAEEVRHHIFGKKHKFIKGASSDPLSYSNIQGSLTHSNAFLDPLEQTHSEDEVAWQQAMNKKAKESLEVDEKNRSFTGDAYKYEDDGWNGF